MNFTAVCRTCLTTECLNPIFVETGDPKSYSSTIFVITGIKVTIDDGLPQQMCEHCITFLNTSLEFRKQCKDSETRLLQVRNGNFNCETVKTLKSEDEAIDNEDFNDEDMQLESKYEEDIISWGDATTKTEVEDIESDHYESGALSSTEEALCKLEPAGGAGECTRPGEGPRCSNSLQQQYGLRSCSVRLQRLHMEDLHTCQACLMTFDCISSLKNHSCTHSVEERHLVRHIATHNVGNPSNKASSVYTGATFYSDNVSETPFENQKVLITHTAENPQPHSCDICSKRFTQKGSLTRHIRIHTGEKPFSCDVCKKQFRIKSTLIVHGLTHTGEKPYSCTVCHKQFRQISNLKRHMLTHAGVKLYKCDECGKRFIQKGALTRHVRIHTGEKPFSCDVCQKQFTQGNDLTLHRRIHTGEKPYCCTVCQKQFRQISNLNVHMLKHAGKTVQTGVTFLLHKSGSTTEAKNYRPITCLPTIYKLLTSILRAKINSHIVANNILAHAQNGCRVGSRGTKELLLIDMTICQQVRRNKAALSAAWIDYKKAYDSVPHSWLRRILELYKVDPTLRSFLSVCMGQWTTVLRQPGGADGLFGPQDSIRIERGIFQGDSLSPLWFCLALNPLSTLLKDSGLGCRLRRGSEVISHLLYMDDLKLFAPKRQDLIELLKIAEVFSSAIKMEFGVDKCAVMHVQRGEVVNSTNLQLSETMSLRSISETETYKYLGMSQSLGIVAGDIKQVLRERFFCRLAKVLNSLLSGGNRVRALNAWVMPLLTYSFGILRWTQTELDALDRRVRHLLTMHRMLHPRSSVMRLYIPRKCGGRGILNAKNLHNREVCSLRDYFLHNECGMHRDVVAVDRNLTPLSLANENWRKPTVLSTEDRKDVWKSKELHGRFYRALSGPDVDLLASVNWLRFGDLFGETEGFVCAIADEVIMTNNYRKYILKDGTVDICRACRRPGESLRHIISGCSHLANDEYLHRHNLVARIIHQQLALQYGLVETEVPYYKYAPAPVLENGRATLYWDRSVITDRTIVANKPDIVLTDRSQRRTVLVDITIPHDENLVKAEKDKLSKYLDLAHEVTAMWDVDSTVIVPIVVSANGLIAKSLDQHLKRLSLGGWVKGQMQKAVLLDTARIVRRFLTLRP